MRHFRRASPQDSPVSLVTRSKPTFVHGNQQSVKLDPRQYGRGGRGMGRAAVSPQHRRQSSTSTPQTMMAPLSSSQDLAGLVTNTQLPVTTAMYQQPWSSPPLPLQANMYQTAPADWSFAGDSFAPNTNYMSPPQQYQNPYAVDWQPPNPMFGAPQGPTQSPYYSAQPMTAPSRQSYPIAPDHNPYGFGPEMQQSSPATTSTSLSSGSIALRATTLPEPTAELPHVCRVRGCGRAYKRKAELDRHTQEKHGPTSGRLLCPVAMCPRGIAGEGFDRMSHLTQHLRSGKHKFSPQQAKFMARQHNPRRGGSGA